MNRIHWSLDRHGARPREKVWEALSLGLDLQGFGRRPSGPALIMSAIMNEGSKILFLGPGEKGVMGMIRLRSPKTGGPERVSIEHLGVVHDGKEDAWPEAVKGLAGARQQYSFKEKDGATELLVDTDTTEEYRSMFEETWPRALKTLKELAQSAGWGCPAGIGHAHPREVGI